MSSSMVHSYDLSHLMTNGLCTNRGDLSYLAGSSSEASNMLHGCF